MSNVAEALAKLEARIGKLNFEDDFELCQFIALSSRMKALGESQYFDQIPEICQKDPYRGRLDEIIQQYAKMYMWDLEKQSGEELALTITEIQDWYCFRQFTKDSDLYDKNTGPYMDGMEDEADLVSLDSEAAALLRDWLDAYPIPEELRLPVVDTPLTDFDYKIGSLVVAFWNR